MNNAEKSAKKAQAVKLALDNLHAWLPHDPYSVETETKISISHPITGVLCALSLNKRTGEVKTTAPRHITPFFFSVLEVYKWFDPRSQVARPYSPPYDVAQAIIDRFGGNEW